MRNLKSLEDHLGIDKSEFRCLYTRCKECNQLMFVHKDNPDVVYCGCKGMTPNG